MHALNWVLDQDPAVIAIPLGRPENSQAITCAIHASLEQARRKTLAVMLSFIHRRVRGSRVMGTGYDLLRVFSGDCHCGRACRTFRITTYNCSTNLPAAFGQDIRNIIRTFVAHGGILCVEVIDADPIATTAHQGIRSWCVAPNGTRWHHAADVR